MINFVIYPSRNLNGTRLIDVKMLEFFLNKPTALIRAHSQPKDHGPIPVKIKYHFLLKSSPIN